jgi:eukaryotic-like serine/threonine-protein kinase
MTQMDSMPRVLSGRYELVHLVARGGMAEVYRAHDRLLDRPVALKVLFSELSVDRTFVERFRREAQNAANLSHPNIVPVFDWGEDGGTYFIVMEFIDGRPLSSILRTAGPLHPDRAAEIGADVALALDFAHSRGVIHRDVKPGNVLITDEGQVKVTDFGIARAVNTDESLTQTGAVMGTATYFSPEQAEGLGVDARSDIYSLGVVLYEMVAGRPPFMGDSPVSVASKHVREQAPAPRQFNPSIPQDLEVVILKCMAKDPEYRYATGGELRIDLLRFHEGREVSAGTMAIPSGTGQFTQALPPVVPPEEEEESRGTGLYIALLLVLLIALGVVAAFLGNSLGWWSFSSKSFALANVTGKTQAQAMSILNSDGLHPVVHTTTSTTSEKGVVLSTDPSSGTQVNKGQQIVLDVGSGVPATVQVMVPDVVGFTLHDAENDLKSAGLKTASVQATCSYPNGEVCYQTPSPHTNAPKGSTVELTVSNVPSTKSYFVPNVTGDTPSKACAAIVAQSLVCAPSSNYVTGNSSTVPSGDVMATLPAQGTPVSSGSTVNLQISQGPAPVTVPNVIGEAEQAASTKLTGDGFVVDTKLDNHDMNQADCGIVTNQNPGAQTSQSAGSTVTIDVGNGPECGTTPTTGSSTTTSTTS